MINEMVSPVATTSNVSSVGLPSSAIQVKSKASRRTIHLPKATVAQLRAHRQRQVAERLKFGGDWPELPLGADLVFRTRFGTPLDRTNVGHYFSKHTKAAGLGHWHPHERRHSTASLLLAQGAPLKVVSKIVRHEWNRVDNRGVRPVLWLLADSGEGLAMRGGRALESPDRVVHVR